MWTHWRATSAILVVFGLGWSMGLAVSGHHLAAAQPRAASPRVFEIRIYTAAEGKLEALQARFRDHTVALFRRHGIESVAYFTTQPGDAPPKTLVYVLAYPSRAAADASWKAFRADPEWQKVRAQSESNGPLTTKIESWFVAPTDYSPLR